MSHAKNHAVYNGVLPTPPAYGVVRRKSQSAWLERCDHYEAVTPFIDGVDLPGTYAAARPLLRAA